MRITRILSTVSLGVVALAGSLKAESSSFTGFGAGLSLGMNSLTSDLIAHTPAAGVIPGGAVSKFGWTGSQVGFALSYGMEFSGPYVGARLGYDMRFLPKEALLQNKHSLKFDAHFGMAIENIVLPTLFVGYGMNKVEFLDEEKQNVGGLRYGARIDFKVAPQVTVGLSSAFWSGKSKEFDERTLKLYTSETTLNVGYHL
jgi:hypothetical protein